MRRTSLFAALALFPGLLLGQERREAPSSAEVAEVFALIASDVAGLAVRTDVAYAGDELVMRVTPASAPGELQRRRPATSTALEARVTRAISGEITRLRVTGAVTAQPRVRVSDTATEEVKLQALRLARFGTTASRDVRAAATQRTAALGAVGAASEAVLVWRPAGAQLQPVWQVRVLVTQKARAAAYRATFDAADGTLLELEREGGR